MKIKFLGAAGTVTGSSYVLTSGSGKSILIDLGMFQGPVVEEMNYQQYEYDVRLLSGAVLTHAHLDHCGRMPILLPNGFSQSIWMTSATADLTELALIDSAKIAKEDNKHILYDKDLAIQTIERFKRVYYRTPFHIGSFSIEMKDAGHIMGSASLLITDDSADSEIRTVVFSGDLGNSPDTLLHETEYFDSADAVVMESTYGDRLHPDEDPMDKVRSEINAVENSGGTLLIPAFSLQRTQELLHLILHLKRKELVRAATPVFLDAPMGNTATAIYTKYPEDFNDHIRGELSGNGPFEFPGLITIGHHGDRDQIRRYIGAKVIIAGSGMMTGGRIVGHAAHYLPMPSTRLLIVGYQGEETLGRELWEGNKNVIIDGHRVHVNASVSDTQAMSSHADQGQLLAWLKHIKNVKKVFLTHGDNGPRKALAEKITQETGIPDIQLPAMNQEISL
jgi:metallo-beta-lactamase family protein